MTQPAPAYQTAYEQHGDPICPECGQDLNGWEAKSVQAHSVAHWEKIDTHESFDEARRRQAILARIAKEASH